MILVSILSSVALSAIAQEKRNSSDDYYLQLNLGYAHGQKPKDNFPQGSMGNTGIYGLEAGYRINENFRFSLSLDYRPDFKNNYSTSAPQSTLHEGAHYPTTAIESYNTKVKSLAAMLNVYYDIMQVNNFTPYLTIGAGISRNRTSSSTKTEYPSGPPDYVMDYSKASNNGLAYKVGLGSRYSVSNNIAIDLRYQYVDLGKFKTGTSISHNGRSIDVNAKKGRLKAHEVMLSLVYKF